MVGWGIAKVITGFRGITADAFESAVLQRISANVQMEPPVGIFSAA